MAKSNWRGNEVEEMLNIIKEHKILALTDGKKYRSLEVYRKVEEKLKKKNIMRTAEQIRNKLKGLRLIYTAIKKNNMKSGHAPMECEHYEILEEIFGNRPNIQCVNNGIDSSFESSKSTSFVVEEEEGTSQREIQTDEPSTSVLRRKTPKNEKYMKEQQKWMETELEKQREFESRIFKEFQDSMDKNFKMLLQCVKQSRNSNFIETGEVFSSSPSPSLVLSSSPPPSSSGSDISQFFQSFDPQDE